MRRFLPGLFILLIFLPGCIRDGRAKSARALLDWVGQQEYSVWQNVKLDGGLGRGPGQLACHHDGFTLGNRHIFAAIGTDPKDLTAISLLWGERKSIRAAGGPLTISGPQAEPRGPWGVPPCPKQTSKRIRHTSIIVTQCCDPAPLASVTVVDLAPFEPELNTLMQAIVVKNESEKAVRSTSVALNFDGGWTFRKNNRNTIAFQNGDLILFCDRKLQAFLPDQPKRAVRRGQTTPCTVRVDLGLLRPKESKLVVFYLIPTDQAHRKRHLAEVKRASRQPLRLIERTKEGWLKWWNEAPIACEDRQIADLIDSILCMIKCHEGFEAIHTGSLKYRHDRAYVRDNYWVQRALLEAGRKEEAKKNLDFFFKMWKKNGICSYYDITQGIGHGYGYQRVELPHYLVLMVRDAERLAGVDPKPYYPMIRDCLKYAAVPKSGFQPMNGDETWLLACSPNELDFMLDNSWLLVASAEYGADLAQRLGKADDAQQWGRMAHRAGQALNKFLSRDTGRLAFTRSADGTLDETLASGPLCRGVVLGIKPDKLAPAIKKGLTDSWASLAYSEGIRAHARTTILDGGTPGYFLYAAAEMNAPFASELMDRLREFCSSTGNVWELHDIYDPQWGGEKRRLWDSAVVMMGLVHFLSKRSQSSEVTSQSTGSQGSQSAWLKKVDDFLGHEAAKIVIVHDGAYAHAAEIAANLVRQKQWWVPIVPLSKASPILAGSRNCIVISKQMPEGPVIFRGRNYLVVRRGSATQIWVKNGGHVYNDTQGLITDLINWSSVRCTKPQPFPGANESIAQKFGQTPNDWLSWSIKMGGKSARFKLNLPKKAGPVSVPGIPEVKISASLAKNLVAWSVAAQAKPAEVAVVLPPGYWVVNSRDYGWDRVADPVEEWHQPDGSKQLIFRLHPSLDRPKSVTLKLAKLIPPPT